MNFNITNLIKNTVNELTGSYSNSVTQVEYEFKKTNGSFSSSIDFTQNLLFPNSSSYSNYNDLTENIVKGWVTGSYETLNTEHGRKKDDGWVTFSTASWSAFETSVESYLKNEISASIKNLEYKGIPW